MISSEKMRKIELAIQSLMRENKLNQSITNQLQPSACQIKETMKYFIYIEICNTNPMINYVFNSDKEITIGRERAWSTICIQDLGISRRHGSVYVQDGHLFVKNISHQNVLYIKSGFHKICIQAGQSVEVLQNEIIKIGSAKMKMYLFQGASYIVN